MKKSGNDLTKFQKDSVKSIMKHFYPDKEGNTNASKDLLADVDYLENTLVERGVIESVGSIKKHFCPDKKGNTNTSKYLLADEVGLGKTLVARGVIEEVREKYSMFAVIFS